MAVQRDDPYEGSNYLVDLGLGDPHDARAAFRTVELPVAELDEIAYRSGNDRRNETRKQPGLARYGRLVLTRPLIGTTDLYEWWDSARNGVPDVDRNVTVTLLDDDRSETVWTWKFVNAFPVVYRFSVLDAAGSGPVDEIIELAFDRIEIA
jgi:phage tail-like protein